LHLQLLSRAGRQRAWAVTCGNFWQTRKAGHWGDESGRRRLDPSGPHRTQFCAGGGLRADYANIQGAVYRRADIAADCLHQVARLARKGESQMSTATLDLHEAPAESSANYLNARYGLKSWLVTLDH